MSDQYPFFAYLSRMRYINRWGLMRNTFQENIQEHSHMVAVLAHALAVIRRDVFGGDADPTTIKYYNPDIRDAYREVEQFSAHKLLHMLPEALRPSFAPLLREGYDPGLRTLVKAADKLSAHIKCVEELKAGNAEFKQAAEQTLETLQVYGLSDLDYFLEHFLPAFGLTLDELQ